MADLITRLKLDNSQYNNSIDSSKQKTKEFQDTADDANKTLNDMSQKGAKSASDLLKEMNKLENAGRSASNYRKQLAEIQKQIVDLTVGYRNMNAEMQQSALGQEVANKIQELTAQAGQYKDAILDAQSSVKALASDTAGWDAIKMGIDTASSALQGFVSMGVLGEQSTEKLVAVIAKLKSIEAGTNAVIKVGNALQKQSALMMGIAKVQAAALAKAKTIEAASTSKATIAQKLFNTVAKANPYVLLAAAIISVGTALYAFTKKTKEATEAEKKHKEQLEKEKEKLDSWAKTVGNSVGSVLSKYKMLQIEWKALETESQKQRWIENNKNAFKELGLKVNSVTDAEHTFVGNTEAVVTALKKRAMAAAKQAQLTELYSKLIEAQTKAEAEYQKNQVTAGSPVGGYSHDATTGNEFVDQRSGKWVYSSKGAANANKNIRNAAYAEANQIQKEIDDLAKDIAADVDVSQLFQPINGGGGGNKVAEAVEGSLRAAQEKVKEIQDKLNNTPSGNVEAIEKLKNDLTEAEAEVTRIQGLLERVNPPKKLDLIPNTLQEANYFVQSLSKQLEELDPNTDEFNEIKELLNIWKQKQEEINAALGTTEKKTELVAGSLAEANHFVQVFSKQLEDLDPNTDEFKEVLELLNLWKQKQEEINDLVDKSTEVKVKVDTKSLTQAIDDVVSLLDKAGGAANGFVGAFNSIYESITGLGDALDEAENGWEAFFAIFQTGMTLFNSFTTIVESIGAVMQVVNAIRGASVPLIEAETKSLEKNTEASISDAAAKGVSAAAGAGESVASIPYLGPILAAAAIATIIAAIFSAISSAKGYAFGGIVPGNSMHGDKIMAGLNSGEMVLNTQQQANLFKMLNEGREERNGGGSVEFKIKGTELVGVLNNQSKKNRHI